MPTLKEIRDAKASCLYQSPITGCWHDSGSWRYDLTDEQLDKIKSSSIGVNNDNTNRNDTSNGSSCSSSCSSRSTTSSVRSRR